MAQTEPIASSAEGLAATLPLTPEDAEALLDEVLEDERLKAEAWAVALDRTELVDLAASQRDALSRVPLELAGVLTESEHRLAAARPPERRQAVRMWSLLALRIAAIWTIPALLIWRSGLRITPWYWAVLIVLLLAIVLALITRYFLRKTVSALSDWRVAEAISRRDLEKAQGAIRLYQRDELAKYIRLEINERDDQKYRTTISNVEASGLADVETTRHLIRTDARERLDRLLQDMPGGSIGLSGPRGAGKSSLIRASCPTGQNQPTGLMGVIVPAPVQFAARDFILHVFAELCRTLLGRDEVERLRRPDPVARSVGHARRRYQFALLPLAAVFITMTGVAMLFVAMGYVNASLVWAGAVTALGALALAFSLPLRRRLFVFGFERSFSDMRFSEEVIDFARQRLIDIWFQQSFTRGWSGSISLPLGLEGGVEGGQELARQQMSMPDIVGELRHFVLMLTSPSGDDEEVGTQVRIGIDELDKIDAIDDARAFMNEIKVLFGIPHCFFIVSISEDAMSQFERRGLPLRDVFDSSFDEVIRVGPLGAVESVALLRERTLGVPVPFMLFCHCMAGGLPRDLIRMARAVVAVGPDQLGSTEPRRLSTVVERLVGQQVRAKVEATAIACRRLPQTPDVASFQSWLEEVRLRATHTDALLRTAADTTPLAIAQAQGGSSDATDTLARELLAYCYFCATIESVFVDDRSAREYRAMTRGDDQAPLADQIAAAHQAFAVHPQAAWQSITLVRDRLELGILPLPRSASPRPCVSLSREATLPPDT